MTDFRAPLTSLALALCLAATAGAAPAPFAKPPRQEPTPEALADGLRADGFAVMRVTRGREPGAYVIVLDEGPSGVYAQVRHLHVRVRSKGAEVRAELRSALAEDRDARQSFRYYSGLIY